MEVKELQGVIEEKFNSLNAQVKESAGKSEAEVKALKDQVEALQAELKSAQEQGVSKEVIEKMQSHLDTLDIKMQGRTKTEEAKSFVDQLTSAFEANKDDLAKLEAKEIKALSLEVKAVGDMTTANVTGSRYGQLFQEGIILNPNRKVHMSAVLLGGSIGPGNSFTFMRENGVGEGSIAPTAEGATKPQFDLDLIENTVNVETIAGWLRISRKMLSNVPGMVSYLNAKLPELFQKALDNQILYGTGVTPQIKGILVSGNFVTSTANAADVLVDKIIHDIATLEDTYDRSANQILLRPADYYKFFSNKAVGSGEYDLPQGVTFEGGILRILGIPVRATTALATNDYVVGDFEGAQLLTQESMRIEFFEQDGNNVTTNKITVRIEGNFALPVYGNNYFIKGSSVVTQGGV